MRPHHSFPTSLLRTALAVASLWGLSSAAAYGASTDFDGDGISDVVAVQIVQKSGELSWSAILSGNGASAALGSFGQVGNHLTIGRWQGGSAPVIGVVANDTARNTILWSFSAGAASTSLSFGTPNDVVVAGADFDGSGALDALVLSKRGKALIWRLMKDPVVAGNRAVNEFRLGRGASPYFFVSLDGTRDVMGVVERKPKGKSLLLLDSVTGKRRRIRFRAALPSLKKLTPVVGANGPDLLLSYKQRAGATRFTFLTLAGKVAARGVIPAAGDLIVGDFDAALPGEEIAIQGSTDVYIYNPAAKRLVTRALPTTALILVDEININSFLGSDTPPQSGNCERLNSSDGQGGFVWKPNSDTQFYAVVVFPGRYHNRISRVETLTSAGDVIKELSAKGCANPEPSGPRCAFQDKSLTGQNYRSTYGSIIVKAVLSDGSCLHYPIADPSRRND